MTEQIFTSRSAILAFKTCHYKRLLQYHLEGSGFTGGAMPLDLLIGTICHRGIQHLLEHCRINHPDGKFDEGCIDEAVDKAKELWRDILSKQSLALYSGEEDRLDWILAEQETLFEGLIRAFALRRLPTILDEYEILEVEKEEISTVFSSIVTLLGKCDGLFLRKHDNKLVILSLKTASMFADVIERDILHDMQGVSEWFLVQERINKAWIIWNSGLVVRDEDLDSQKFIKDYYWLKNFTICPKIFAVQYEYLIKGQRKQDPYNSGIYKQQSFLCHPLKLDAIPTMNFSTGIIINPDEYKWKWGAGKYSKGWNKCDIWEEIGIKNWIEMLALGQVQPEEGHPFDKILITPDLIVRDEREIEEWLVSTRFQEEQIAEHLRDIANCTMEGWESESTEEDIQANKKYVQELLWQHFDKNTLSCHNFYGKDCLFSRHCHEFSSIEELRDAGYLIPRRSHHQAEENYQIQQGFIEDGITNK